jgi:hypothetical protein
MTLSRDMTRLRISDASLMEDFAQFLLRSGFVVEPEDADTVRLRLPLTPGPTRSAADIETLLDVWLVIGLRIWHDLWPDADVIVLPDAEPVAEPAPSHTALAS